MTDVFSGDLKAASSTLAVGLWKHAVSFFSPVLRFSSSRRLRSEAQRTFRRGVDHVMGTYPWLVQATFCVVDLFKCVGGANASVSGGSMKDVERCCYT